MMHLRDSTVEALLRGRASCERFAVALHGIGEELAEKSRALPQFARTLRALRAAEALLRRPLRVALLGESNAGKSTLANLMLGNAVLPTLQLSNTPIPTLIRHAPQPTVTAILEGGSSRPLTPGQRAPDNMICAAVGLPIPHLLACEVIDFPGFADPWLGYRSSDVVRHRVDISVWCTFSTQAWKESERAAWSRLPKRMRANALLLGTSKDLLRDEQALKVAARLASSGGPEFRSSLLISSMQARRALDAHGAVRDVSQWRASGAAEYFTALGTLVAEIRAARLKRTQAFANRIAGEALARFR